MSIIIFFCGLLIGFTSLVLSFFSGVDVLRVIFGLSFVYFFPGYPLACLLLPPKFSSLGKILTAVGLSLLLTYPAGFLNVLKEGQGGAAIFGYHLSGDIGMLLGLYVLLSILTFCKKGFSRIVSSLKIDKKFSLLVLFIPIVISTFFNFHDLNRADLNGDEYDLGYQAYNLVDGIFAGRNGYVISFSAHPPLAMYIQHFTMQVLEPNGLDLLSDWMFRFAPALLGVITVGTIYALIYEVTQKWSLALLASSLLAVNNYHIFLSRIFQREMFLEFFIILFSYTFLNSLILKENKLLLLSAIFLGAAMLTKAVALIFVPLALILLFISNKENFIQKTKYFLTTFLIVILPVIVYNIMAYFKTGYTDILFSSIFRTKTNPGATIFQINIPAVSNSLLLLLVDQYGSLLLIAFFLSALFVVTQRWDLLASFSLLSSIFIIIFFIYIGVKPYYLPFLTPFVIIILSLALYRLNSHKNFAVAVSLILLIYSTVYSYRTFLLRSPRVNEGYTQGYPNLKENVSKNYSSTSRAFLEERGWKSLSGDLDRNYSAESCLVIDLNDHPLQLRRYLGIGDKIKEFYLGATYNPKYKLCSRLSTSKDKWVIKTTDREVTYERISS